MKRSVKKALAVLFLTGTAASVTPWSGSDWETVGAWSSIVSPSVASAQDVVSSEEQPAEPAPILLDNAAPLEGPPAAETEEETAPDAWQPRVEEEEIAAESEAEPEDAAPSDAMEAPAEEMTDEVVDETPAVEAPLLLPAVTTPAPWIPRPVSEKSETPTSDSASRTVMAEWITPKTISRGRETEFKLVVRNTLKHVAKNVAVHVQLPEHAELGKCQPQPSQSEGVLLWKIGQLEAGATKTITLAITPLERGEFEPQAAVTFTRASSTKVEIVEPELALSIDSSPRAVIGQRGGCVLVVHNHGNGPAAGVVVSAALPESLAPTTAEEARYQLGTIPAGESREIEFPIYAHKLGSHEVSFQVTCLGSAPKEIAQTLEVVQPTVQVAVDGPKLRYVERQANYVIRLENPGPAPINNVQVIENIPAGFEFIEATGGGDYDHETRQVAWFVGRLEPNATTTVEVKLNPSELGEHTVTTQVKADAGVNATAQAVTRVEGVSSILLEVVDRDDPIEVAGETLYEIRVTNQGTKPATGLQVAAAVPKQMETLEIDGPTDGAIDGDKIVFEPIEELAPGSTETFKVHVRCNGEGHVRFRAYFRTTDSAAPVLEEELTHIYKD